MSHATRLNRRTLLAGMGSLLAMQTLGLATRTHQEWLENFDGHFEGFEQLSDREYLAFGMQESLVELSVERSENSLICRFSLPQESLVYLSASARVETQAFVYPLLVQLAKQQLLLPVLCSSTHRLPNTITLGRFEQGEHQVVVFQDSSLTGEIPESLQLVMTVPKPESLAAKLTERTPAVRLKNPRNPLDDIPLEGFSVVRKHLDGRYLVTTYLVFSSENGGLYPVSLYQIYGRTYDIEWVTQQIFDQFGQAISGLQRFQSPNHGIERFAGTMWGDAPILAVATANNNFADNRRRFWQRGRLSKTHSGVLYAARPRFFRNYEDATKALLSKEELQQWSLIELALEGCVDLSDQANPDTIALSQNLALVSQQLSTTYPNRGCGQATLQLPQEISLGP